MLGFFDITPTAFGCVKDLPTSASPYAGGGGVF
jgi:hypothetical protein